MCKPKEEGSFGFRSISSRNRAFLGKWLWRYPRESIALWHKVILGMYETHPND